MNNDSLPSIEELRQLDAATRMAEAELKAMVTQLDANAKSHRAFMAEIRKLRASGRARRSRLSRLR